MAVQGVSFSMPPTMPRPDRRTQGRRPRSRRDLRHESASAVSAVTAGVGPPCTWDPTGSRQHAVPDRRGANRGGGAAHMRTSLSAAVRLALRRWLTAQRSGDAPNRAGGMTDAGRRALHPSRPSPAVKRRAPTTPADVTADSRAAHRRAVRLRTSSHTGCDAPHRPAGARTPTLGRSTLATLSFGGHPEQRAACPRRGMRFSEMDAMRGAAPLTTDDLLVDPLSTDRVGSERSGAACAGSARRGRQDGDGLDPAAPAAGQQDR
jgi:hypothetical protein